MTTKITQVNKEALAPVVTSRQKAIDLAQAAEQAMKDARLAELEFKVQIQQLYIEKGLDINCRVDISTGVVTWPEETPPEVEGELVPTPIAAASKRTRAGKKKVVEAEGVDADSAEAEEVG